MGLGKICRFCGKVAALVAMAALLLQASCTIGFTSPGRAAIAATDDSGCHGSAPATPHTPSSGQMCCNGDHSPEALLTAVQVPPALPAAVKLVPVPFNSSNPFRHAVATVTPSHGPPPLLTLRI